MSEYQYYEFAAIDRPLTRTEQAELRAISSRAEISALRFVNTYNYGSFRGDSARLLEQYFDARIYVSNFGNREFAVRLPIDAIDRARMEPYLCDALTLTTTPTHALLTFAWNDENSHWVDESSGPTWFAALCAIRAQLLRGDLRSLYAAWLYNASMILMRDDHDEDAAEPPVPAGLKTPDVALDALVEFFEIDQDLFTAAAETSADTSDPAVDSAALARWIATQSVRVKNAWLERVASGEGIPVQNEIFRAWSSTRGAPASEAPRRLFHELQQIAVVHATARREREAKAARKQQAREEKARAAALQTRLKAIVANKGSAWKKFDALCAAQKATQYAEAVALLQDLHALAERENDLPAFTKQVAERMARLSPGSALRKRIRAAQIDAG